MNKNLSLRQLPSTEGLVEPFLSNYLEFSRQARELMLNPKQLYGMHARKKFKLMELQKHPERMGRSVEHGKKKDKTKSRSIFASNRPRDSKGRFFSKDSQEHSEAPIEKKEEPEPIVEKPIENPLEMMEEEPCWNLEEEDFYMYPQLSMGKWDSNQPPQANSMYMNDEFFNENY